MQGFLIYYKSALLILAGVLLRDVLCWSAAKLFCWRRRRQSQRQAEQFLQQRERDVQAQAARIAANIRARRPEVIAALRTPCVPFPELLNGPLIIDAGSDNEALRVSRQLISNFSAQRKQISFGNGEDN